MTLRHTCIKIKNHGKSILPLSLVSNINIRRKIYFICTHRSPAIPNSHLFFFFYKGAEVTASLFNKRKDGLLYTLFFLYAKYGRKNSTCESSFL